MSRRTCRGGQGTPEPHCSPFPEGLTAGPQAGLRDVPELRGASAGLLVAAGLLPCAPSLASPGALETRLMSAFRARVHLASSLPLCSVPAPAPQTGDSHGARWQCSCAPCLHPLPAPGGSGLRSRTDMMPVMCPRDSPASSRICFFPFSPSSSFLNTMTQASRATCGHRVAPGPGPRSGDLSPHVVPVVGALALRHPTKPSSPGTNSQTSLFGFPFSQNPNICFS